MGKESSPIAVGSKHILATLSAILLAILSAQGEPYVD